MKQALYTLAKAVFTKLGVGPIKTAIDNAFGVNDGNWNTQQNQIDYLTGLYSLAQQGLSIIADPKFPPANIKLAIQPLDDVMLLLKQELCIQRDMEDRWENLVRTMAPDCAGIDRVLNTVKTVIQGAIDRVSGQANTQCPPFDPKIPPHYETSLGDIFDDSIGKV